MSQRDPEPDALAATRVDPAASGRDPRATEPAPGASIGRFRVTGVLGRGAMGVVLSAHDPELDRRVAIKLVRPTGTAEEAGLLRSRLLREARAMARLRHPNVVSVYEAGEHDGQVYVAMEHVEGGTLTEAVAAMGEARDWRAVVALFVDAARGLAAAHAAGLVHRDFKPDNVLVDRAGRALVGDFGLVLAAEPDLARALASSEPDSLALTRADTVVGSPAYMAPEQWTGDEVDARSDQYAFCVALYEALYGQLPFAGTRVASYSAAVLAGEIRPPRDNHGVPAWLHHVVVQGLALRPERRFASMTRLVAELGLDWRSARRPGHRERSLLLVALGAFVAAWAVATIALGVEPSYAAHYGTQGAFLGLTLIFGVLAWPAIIVSRFNLVTYLIVAMVGAIPLVVAVGIQHLGIPARHLEVINLAVIGTAFGAGSVALDWRIVAGGLNYLIAFFVAAFVPASIPIVTPAAHAIAVAVVIVVFDRRGRAGG